MKNNNNNYKNTKIILKIAYISPIAPSTRTAIGTPQPHVHIALSN